MLSRAGALLLVLLLASTALPASAAYDLTVDPRFELLGVVQQLAGGGDAGDAPQYRQRATERFAAFREHPAVRLYADLASRGSREAAAATLMLYYSAPPELALKDPDADIHHLNGPDEAAEMQRFIRELRDFARVSDFARFFGENRAYYAKLEAEARRTLGTVDPAAVIESYVGVSLESRSHYILLPRRGSTLSFIVPYPLPPANAGARAFDVYTMSPDFGSGVVSNHVWTEPLYVFIDPSFYYFEKLNIPVPEEFYGADAARCRAAGPDCVKHCAVVAILRHLNRKAGLSPAPGKSNGAASPLESRLIDALSARLDEYDAHRDRYPTLWDFYPRWFSVFEETAFPGRAPRALTVPSSPKISRTTQFFDPAAVAALLRTGAR